MKVPFFFDFLLPDGFFTSSSSVTSPSSSDASTTTCVGGVGGIGVVEVPWEGGIGTVLLPVIKVFLDLALGGDRTI